MRKVGWAERQARRADRFQGNGVALVIGVVGTGYGGLGVGFASQNAMDTVWNIPYVRWPNFWKRYARTFGMIGLLGPAVVSSTALAAFVTFVTAIAHGLAATALAVVGSVLVNLGVFLLGFMVLTAEPLRPREVAAGAIFATVFWESLQLIGTWYVTRGLRNAGLIIQPLLTEADKLTLIRRPGMEVRRPEEEVTASYRRCRRRPAGKRAMTRPEPAITPAGWQWT